jgi:hypothetical protein
MPLFYIRPYTKHRLEEKPMFPVRFVLLPLMMIATAPLHAQDAMSPDASVCPATPAPLPAGLAGWAKRVPVSAAATVAGLGAATLQPGVGADVTLRATPDVAYPLRPDHPGGSVSSGGLLGVTIADAGTYRISIGSPAWLDVVRDGKALPSTRHGPGPVCSGMRKTVDFALQPGAYILQVAGNGTPSLSILVSRVP